MGSQKLASLSLCLLNPIKPIASHAPPPLRSHTHHPSFPQVHNMLASFTWMLLAAATLSPIAAAPSSPAPQPRALNALCNIIPSFLGGDICKACIAQFKDPYAKSCTVAALTSCSGGRLVHKGLSCVQTCPASYHSDSTSELTTVRLKRLSHH